MSVRRALLIPILLLFAAACGGSSDPANNFAPPATVIDWRVGTTGLLTTIRDGEFIAWRSVDGMHHTVTSSSTPADFAEVDVPAGGSSEAVKFTLPGAYRYFCSIHGETVQSGTVRVLVPGS